MIIFKRFGGLVILSVGISMGITFGIIELLGLNKTLAGGNEAFKMVMRYIFWMPAFINYLFCKIFLKNEREEIVTAQDGKQYKINNYSSLFFIRNIYWTPILLIFMPYMAFVLIK